MTVPTDPQTGEFVRSPNHFCARITADGRDGWPVEPGRYRLVVSRACPWASRAAVRGRHPARPATGRGGRTAAVVQ